MAVLIDQALPSAVSRLTAKEAKRVWTFLTKFLDNPAHPGLSFERIAKTKNQNLWSARISQDLRAILYKDGETWTVLHADHHDAAYHWAQTKQITRHSKTGALQIIASSEVVKKQIQNYTTLHHYECSNESYTLELGSGIKLTMMLIPAGEFMMGSADDDDNGSGSERPQHRVKLPQFLMGATLVTQAQWRVVAGYDVENIALKPEPSGFKGDDLPVEQVRWEEATEFCQRLSKRTGKLFQLPSEAQWEYACRAGTETVCHFGPQITHELANYAKEIGQTTAVKQYLPNRWGLYDMHGNVWEWCQDHWHNNYKGAPTDGSAWIEGGNSAERVLRGGSWDDVPRPCCSAFRFDLTPDDANDDVGFRVSCSAPRALV